jgi:hypothetical protein
VLDAKENIAPKLPFQPNDLTSDQLMAGFRARQASSAYQEMLVRTMCLRFVRGTYFFPQYQRNRLPIARYRDEIISHLNQSQILVLSGETGWCLIYTYLQRSPSNTMDYNQWQVNASTNVHTGGSTVPRQAMQDILHGTTSYIGYLSCPARLPRTGRSSWCCWDNEFSRGLFNPTRKQHVQKYTSGFCDQWYRVEDAGRRHRAGWPRNGLR